MNKYKAQFLRFWINNLQNSKFQIYYKIIIYTYITVFNIIFICNLFGIISLEQREIYILIIMLLLLILLMESSYSTFNFKGTAAEAKDLFDLKEKSKFYIFEDGEDQTCEVLISTNLLHKKLSILSNKIKNMDKEIFKKNLFP